MQLLNLRPRPRSKQKTPLETYSPDALHGRFRDNHEGDAIYFVLPFAVLLSIAAYYFGVGRVLLLVVATVIGGHRVYLLIGKRHQGP